MSDNPTQHSSIFKRGDLCHISSNTDYAPNELSYTTPLVVVSVASAIEALRTLLSHSRLDKERIDHYLEGANQELQDEAMSVVKVLFPDGTTHDFFDYELEHY